MLFARAFLVPAEVPVLFSRAILFPQEALELFARAILVSEEVPVLFAARSSSRARSRGSSPARSST